MASDRFRTYPKKHFKLQGFEKTAEEDLPLVDYSSEQVLELPLKDALLCPQERSVILSEDRDTAERDLSEQAFLTSPAGHTRLLHSDLSLFYTAVRSPPPRAQKCSGLTASLGLHVLKAPLSPNTYAQYICMLCSW